MIAIYIYIYIYIHTLFSFWPVWETVIVFVHCKTLLLPHIDLKSAIKNLIVYRSLKKEMQVVI
jgi:hypothetical protein